MQVIVQPIGTQSDFRLLEEACLTLNILQTLWQFKVQTAIPRPPKNGLGPERFEQSLALEIIPPVEELNGDPEGLAVGAFAGRVDLKGFLSAYYPLCKKGIVSEFDWNDKSETIRRTLWILALVNLALRHYIGAECNKEGCLAHHSLNITNFERTLATLILCDQCRDKLKVLDPYRVEEINELFTWIKTKAINAYDPRDLISFSNPSLPVLVRQGRRQLEEKGADLFNHYGILLIMHFLDDLIPFIERLKSLGARDESICLLVKPYPYGNRRGVGGYLAYHYGNIKTVYLRSLPPAEALMKKAIETCLQRAKSGKFLVIEDGGYIVPFIHDKCPSYQDICIGAVEQTSKGIKRDEKIIGLNIPVIDVAKSDFKDRVEAPLVGKSIIYNLQRILEPLGILLSGKKAVVVGYGAIGKEVAQGLKDFNMNVHVADINPIPLCEAALRGYPIGKLEDLVEGATLIIGTTGGTEEGDKLSPTISGNVLRKLSDGAILVSASSDQIEIDLRELKAMARASRVEGLGTWYTVECDRRDEKYLVIGDGYPINFFRGQGIPNQAIDPILTQLLLGAIHLVTNTSGQKGIIKNIADKLVKENKVIDDLLHAHHLLS